MYAKLIDGRLVSAPKMLRTEQGDVYNPTADILLAAGYKPVTETPYPEVDEDAPVSYTARYEETENAIVQSWEIVGERSIT